MTKNHTIEEKFDQNSKVFAIIFTFFRYNLMQNWIVSAHSAIDIDQWDGRIYVTPNKMLSGSARGSISKQSDFKCADITL